MDKNKIIEAAAKLVAKGAYDKAIKEYQKVLDADPKDVRTLQKMGELYQKKGDNQQAAFYFTKVAESYSTDGFFLKAVALFKQVLKLDPNLMDVNLRLAELHQQLQLMSEAMAYYQIVANHFDKQGDTVKSLDTLKKMVDLDPDNIASRIKLAELYAREQMTGEAVAEFRRAAEHLKRNNRTDDYLRVAERIATLEPNNLQLARELAEIYLQKGDQKRALAKLQVCFKADPRDIETLTLLANAFQGLGQTSKTISVYKELAKVYQDNGRNNDADEVWSKIEALDPNDPDLAARSPAPAPAPVMPSRTAQQPAHQAKTAVAQAYSPQQAARAPAPAAAAEPSKDLNLAKLLTETDVYVKYGLHDKALEHLRKVFAVDPENIDAHEKAYHIYEAANQHAQAQEQLLNVLRLHTRSGDRARAAPYLNTILQQNPSHPEVPVFVAALKGGTAAAGAESEDVAEDAILVDSSDEEIIVADGADDALAIAAASDEPSGHDSAGVHEYSLDDAEASHGSGYDLDPVGSSDSVQVSQDVMGDEPLAPPVASDDEPPGEDVMLVTTPGVQSPALASPQPELEERDEQTGENEIPVPEMGSPRPAYELEPEGPTQVFTVPPDDNSKMTAAYPAYMRPGASATEDEIVEEDGLDDGSAAAAELAAEMPSHTAEEPALDRPAYDEEPVELPPEEASEVSDDEFVEAPPDTSAETSDEPALAAPPPAEEEPASEECDEATFFIEQGLFEEAKEILETVQIAYPGHRKAAELMARIEAAESGEAPPSSMQMQPPAHENGANGTNGSGAHEVPAESEKDAFDSRGRAGERAGRHARRGDLWPHRGAVAGLPGLGRRGVQRVQEGPREDREARRRRHPLRPRHRLQRDGPDRRRDRRVRDRAQGRRGQTQRDRLPLDDRPAAPGPRRGSGGDRRVHVGAHQRARQGRGREGDSLRAGRGVRAGRQAGQGARPVPQGAGARRRLPRGGADGGAVVGDDGA
ncbi:MAG: tetratricopeptide repeat protein [Myxococcaceae bacterium]